MLGIGSSSSTNVLAALMLAALFAACGDNKQEAKSPSERQDSEMTDETGSEGEGEVPPLEEVEPASEDVEVPPAP